MTILDIAEGCAYPASKLSNFEAYIFKVGDVSCNSMEGFVQSLKFSDPEKQKEICLLVGKAAKFKGKKKKWWILQRLYWSGKEIDRHGSEYQELLDLAFASLAKNEDFKKVLLDTNDAIISHSEGKTDPYYTILTQDELCSRLMNIRNSIKGE